MGNKAARERAAQGQFRRGGRLVSEAERDRMHSVGEKALQHMSTGDQIQVMIDSVRQGRLSKADLRGKMSSNAVVEMRKGADKLRKKKKKPVTVDELLKEYRAPENRKFRQLCNEIELPESFFVGLAEAECARR